jgi:hypothetical protein
MNIYLDQNKWIDLARAILRPSEYPTYVDVANKITSKTASGEWILPISMIHFIETCLRKDVESRKKLAKVISDIAKNHSIRPFVYVEPCEFINKYSSIYKSDIKFQINVITSNLFEAISAKGFEINIKKDMPIEIKTQIEEIFRKKIIEDDKIFLELMELFDDETFADDQKRDDETIKIEFERMQLIFASQPKQFRYKLFLSNSFIDALKKYYPFLMKLFDKSLKELLPDELISNEQNIIDLLESIPSLDVRVKLMYELLKDENRKPDLHDGRDIIFLSTAIPYTDIVIMEKNWCHLAKSAKLDTKYNTIIENDLQFLMSL